MSLDRPNQTIVRPAIVGIGPTPGVTPGAVAQLGTGPTATATGSQMGLEVTLTTGASPSAFAAGSPVTLFTLAMPAGGLPIYQSAPSYCTVDPSNQAAAQLMAGALTAGTQSLMVYYDRAASTPSALVFKAVAGSGGTPTLAASTALKFIVSILG